MTERIDKLTRKQQDELPAIREEWLAHGLSTQPADRSAAEDGVNDAYRSAGLEPPPLVIWLDSPLAGAIGTAFVQRLLKALHEGGQVFGQVGGQVLDQVRGQVGGQVRDQVLDQVGDQVLDQVGGQVGDQVGGQVGGQVRGQVGGQVLDQVGGQVGGQVLDQVLDQVGDQVLDQVGGQVGDQVGGQVGGQVLDQVLGQVLDQVGGQVGGQVGDQVGGQVLDQVRDQVGGQVLDQVGGQVGGQVLDQVGGQVRDQVRDQVGGQVLDQVGGQVRDQVRDQVLGQVGDLYWRAIWGQHEAGWLSWIDTFRRFGLKACEPADGLVKVGKSAGWWWPLEGAVVLTERPAQLHRDDEGRLHCADGAAVLYPDGWGVWAIHGVRVTEQIVEHPETLTVEEIRDETNAEVRRVMIERFTPERYLPESKAVMLDEVHEPPFPGLLHAQLWQADRPEDTPLVMVKCRNSSPEPDGSFKDYWLRVDPQCKTAHEALAWTWGMDVNEYRPLVET